MNSPTERLKAVRDNLDLLEATVSHNTSESLLEWNLRRLALEIELIKAEALVRLSDKGWPLDN